MVGALTLTFTACADSTGVDTLDEALYQDMAVVAADATLEDVSTWSLPFEFGSAMGAPAGQPGAPTTPGGMAPAGPGGHHGIGSSLSGTRTVTFYAADGAEQDGYDALTTASISFILDVSGEVTREGWTASIARTKEMTVTGLEGEETHRTFNGEGTESVSGTRTLLDGTVRTHVMNGTFTYTDVVVPVPGSEPRYPISGTITRSMTVTISGPRGERTRSVEMTITFDGDSTATLLVNGEAHEIDLTAQPGRHPLMRHGG